ncbi:MAG: hypothetical protein NC231_12415 [Bacillus sp. (in: Bacteria)]|nr:hypothetical protein [Bacillus sp. (in: firmicutes)]MCM1427859.1 hypothetical protein [Eubacterium sp.]
MKIRKNLVMRMISAAKIMSTAITMAVFPSYAVDADNINSRGNIILEDESGEVALYASDIEILQEELDNLYSELPDTVADPVYPSIRREKIKSCGIIDYAGGTVVLDSTDLIYLADEIDELEAIYKQEILQALNEINTYYEDYEYIVHEENTTIYPTRLSLEQLTSGILNSQTVETGTIADNLSKEKGAWVNGEYIEGNGADNQTAYNQGYTDGFNKAMDGVDISYVYHEHNGEQSGAGTGCYQGYHVHTNSCPYYEKDEGECGGGFEFHDGWFYCKRCSYAGAGQHPNSSHHRYSTEYTCGSPYNAWRIVCGKTPGVSIESATLVFK